MTALRTLHCLAVASVLALTAPSQKTAQPPIRDPRAAVQELPANPSDPDGHPAVVLSPKGNPVAGASVVVVDYGNIDRKLRRKTLQEARSRFAGDADAGPLLLAARHGRRYVTGSDGAVRFARVARGLVVAISGPHVVHTTIRLREGREPRLLNLKLRTVPGIDVLVVDSRGRPVRGAPVSVEYRGRAFSHAHWRPGDENARTNAQGRVRLKPLRPYSDSMDAWVTLRAPKAIHDGVQVDPKTFVNDPTRPIQLVVSDYGSVRVMVEDPEKRPVENLTQVFMTVQQGSQQRSFEATSLDKGFATFEFVPIGLRFEIFCQIDNTTRPNRISGSGPRHPRDMRVLRLTGVTAPPILTFRVLGLDKKPLARETLGLILSSESSISTTTITLDGEGRGTIKIEPPYATEEGRLTMTRRGGSDEAYYLGAIQFPFSKFAKKRALGDLQLREEKLLVRGRAVDETGKPVAGIYLTMPHSYHYSEHFSGTSYRMRHDSRYRYWAHCVRTDAEGRFEFRQIGDPPSDCVISIEANGDADYVIAKGEAPEVGTRDHTLVLQRAGKIRGSISGIPGKQNHWGAIQVVDDADLPVKVQVRWRPGGQFEVDRCPPGTYSVRFKGPNQREPFLVVAKVQVLPGKTCADPRLQDIDISKHFRFLTVTVLAPDGKPYPDAHYSIITRKGNGGYSSHGSRVDAQGRFLVVKSKQALDVGIYDRGRRFRQVRIENIQSDMTIKLKPAWKVRVTVAGMPKQAAQFPYRVTLRPQNGGRKSWPAHYDRGQMLGPKRVVTLEIDYPGTYAVTVRPVKQKKDADLVLPNLKGSVQIKPEQATDRRIELKIDCSAEDKDLLENAIQERKDAEKKR